MEVLPMKTFQRNNYLTWLRTWQDKQIIKVISGVRRCGKSTLFDLFRTHLLQTGVEQTQIIALNFEDLQFEELTDYRRLYDYLDPLLLPDKMNYIFLDEIQHVTHYEKAVDSLFIKSNCDVYITGSNAYFMSGELATLLSGRYIELQMLPLSFREFTLGLGDDKKSLSAPEKFNLYLENSSFPYVLRYNQFGKEARDYLRDVYNTILLKDVMQRNKIADSSNLENISKFMFHNIGNLTSSNKIANTLKAKGQSVDQKTVDKYIQSLVDSLLFYEAPRYNIRGRQLLTRQSKYYAVDLGMRYVLVPTQPSDIGHILENIVYLELRRRGYEVFVGTAGSQEIDFVAMKDAQIEYYQVAASTLDERTAQRELSAFKQVEDNYPKFLLTLDESFGTANYNGVQKVNIIAWLLEGKD